MPIGIFESLESQLVRSVQLSRTRELSEETAKCLVGFQLRDLGSRFVQKRPAKLPRGSARQSRPRCELSRRLCSSVAVAAAVGDLMAKWGRPSGSASAKGPAWRRGGDLNPRDPFESTRSPGVRLKPGSATSPRSKSFRGRDASMPSAALCAPPDPIAGRRWLRASIPTRRRPCADRMPHADRPVRW